MAWSKEINSDSKVAWNASQGIISEISNRRATANTFFINGNIKKAFNTLISMKQSVIQSFKPEEREELKKIETNFHRIYNALSSTLSQSFNSKDKEIFNSANVISNRLYSNYNELLMDLLNKRGYLVGEQSDASRMKF
jgi:flagellin-specific chaperone FliS